MNEPLKPQQLDAYLARIGFDGPRAPDLSALDALHRAHVLTIPFENLDVQLGDPPTLDPVRIFEKLVTRRRGGWCYEQNGLFGRALATLGFPVTRLSAGVMRQLRGEFAMGSHLALKVTAEGRDWLCDVGFGSTQLAPLPFAAGTWAEAPLAGELGQVEDGYWRLAITEGPMPLSFDFHDQPAEEARLEALCAWQASDPESIFVQNLVVQQRRPSGHDMLRGKVLTLTRTKDSEERELASAEELVAVLHELFGLDVPEAAGLWPAIEARHAALFA
ncbi:MULTISPECIES: arylamine N-acetyltransferase [unclassified Novosphingobium]|uniref:arylamine N-acetyltransferase family protein n=1 Tax=unclassified Novosphingobium TaxID=2644732 RepID=UPI000EC5156C|nr:MULTISPECIES: arylamine N-acetyltransferase [unclassified Novosphingobium]HCF24669.1 acetyltransferase [Novosphingobium sp.]HQV03927.1 arylamine N-acetyltransferase [Novosphingobium sp.]